MGEGRQITGYGATSRKGSETLNASAPSTLSILSDYSDISNKRGRWRRLRSCFALQLCPNSGAACSEEA